MKYLLGTDIDTTSTKTIICNEKGDIVRVESAGQNLYSEYSGWVEEEPEEWWRNTVNTIKQILKKSDIAREKF